MKNVRGLFTDTQPIDQPEGFYRYAENLVVNKRLGAVANELGQEVTSSLQAGSKILGYIYLPDDSVVLFTHQPSQNTSRIIWVKHGTQDVKVEDVGNDVLSFNEDSKIEGVSRINFKGEPIIYWTDNLNPPRTLNLENVPSSPHYNSFNLFPFIDSVAKIDSLSVNSSGGNLESGAYYFALAYVSDDDVETDYFSISNPVYINDSIDTSSPDTFDGAPAGRRTSKSITITISDIDTSYKHVRLGIIPLIGGTFGDVSRLDIAIDPNSTEIRYNYTGFRDKIIENIDNIVIPKAFYERAKSMTSVDNRLYIGNVQGREDIGYQRYANNITLQASTESLNSARNTASPNKETMNSYKNPEITITKKGYRRDEVYAFYISFVLNSGAESRAYHIPGRQAETVSIGGNTYSETAPLPVAHKFHSQANAITNNPRIYQFESRAGSNGMGFWQNENETYPATGLDWTGLHGQKVRHHKFPEHQYAPILGGASDYNVMRVSFHNIFIPNEIKEKVRGYKIYYAKRTPENSTVIDQSVGYPARTYEGVTHNNIPAESSGGSGPVSIFSFRPFKLMHSQQNVGSFSYIKSISIPSALIANQDTNKYLLSHFMNSYSGDNFDRLGVIAGAAFVPADTDMVNLAGAGFANDYKTKDSEGALVVRLTSPIATGYSYIGSSPFTQYPVYSFNIHRKDLFRSFDQQMLVWTGFYTENLNTTSTPPIFGGDTYIGHYFVRQSRSSGQSMTDMDALIGTVVESEYNVSWRHTGENYEEKYFPAVDAQTMFDLETDSPSSVPPYYDNYYGYNTDYSALSDIKAVEPFSKRYEEVVSFPTRIIRSREVSVSRTQDNFRVFLQNDYLDMPRERGELVKIGRLNNNLIPHFKRGIFRTKGREEMQVDDFRAYIGSGDIFSVNPDELIPTKVGFGGISELDHAIETEFGYFFIDRQAKRIFLFSQNLEELSSLKYGMHNFFKQNIKDDSLLSLGYDPENKRIMLTDHHNEWTISYYPENEAWGSFHTYHPVNYFNTLNDSYVYYGNSTSIYKLNTGNPSSDRPMVYEFVDNRAPETSKLVSSFTMNTEVFPVGSNNSRIDKTFDTARFYNSHQNTGTINLVGDNVRRIKSRWNISAIRHQEVPSSAFFGYGWAFRKRLNDSYTIVRLTYLNSDGFLLYLYDASINYREIIR